jgi:alkylation response protein AidB-like acyl-CoA dehydrogenase
MFNMMNEARIGVGLGAVMLGYTGYLQSLDYARNRPQGRPPANKDPSQPQIPLIEHTDVRRMLLAQKSYVEGGLALILYCARLVDEEKTDDSTEARTSATLLLDILTPIAKSWPSQWCLEANNLAIQIHGGYGYTREYNVEQLYRDNRLNPIHEGTHGIQAIDLLGRKVVMNSGAAMKLLSEKILDTLVRAEKCQLTEHSGALGKRWKRLLHTTEILHGANDLNLTLANASIYLEAFGHLVMSWIWLEQAIAAHAAQRGDQGFYAGKRQACDWFFRWELPRVDAQLDLLDSFDKTTLTMQDNWF